MTKWEYKIITINQDEIISQLDELGSLGWELCSYDFTSKIAILKRQYKHELELSMKDGSKEVLKLR